MPRTDLDPKSPPGRDAGAWRRGLLAVIVLLTCEGAASAQWVEREYDLRAGWNAIALDVDPADAAPETLLAGVEWRSVWTRIDDEDGTSRWISTHRDEPEFLASLHAMRGGRGYWIDTAAAATLHVKGRPVTRPLSIRGGDFVPVHLPVDASTGAVAGEWISGTRLAGEEFSLYEVDGGTVRAVGDASTLRRGSVYWILAAKDISSVSPFEVRAGATGLSFSQSANVQRIEVEVPVSSASRQLFVRARPSASGPGSPAPGAADWLEIFDEPSGEWRDLDAGASVAIARGATSASLSVRASRDDLSPQAGVVSARDLALIEITGAEGTQAVVGATLELPTVDGIWVGEARVAEVSTTAARGGDLAPTAPVGVALILEVSQDGSEVRLLDEAKVTIDRDGRELTVRLGAALFPEPVDLDGTIDASGGAGSLEGRLAIAATHPRQPYRHHQNPEHTEGWDVERTIRLDIDGGSGTGSDPGDVLSTVGSLRGTFREEVRGLTPEPVRLRGRFVLRKIAEPGQLVSGTP